MSRGKQKKDAEKTREKSSVSFEEEKKVEENTDLKNGEEESRRPGLWEWILSFSRGSTHSESQTNPQGHPDDPQLKKVDAGHLPRRKTLWPKKTPDPAVEGETSTEPERNQNVQPTDAKSTHREPDAYGSYYMPCCPCSAPLNEQPCMPQWCFSYKYIDWLTIVSLITCFCWGTLYAVLPETASPQGALFTLSAVAIVAYAAGHASAYFMRLPPTLFMFVVGFAFRNSAIWKNTSHFAYSEVEGAKAFILTVMVTKAALYVDGKIFLKYPLTILLLGIVPCVCEISAVGLILYVISGLDMVTAFTTATVLANVSSVVISHSLVTLANAGYGAHTGIISILMAAAPVDGIIVLTILGVLVAGDEAGVANGFVTLGEQLAGILLGTLVGALLAFVPSRNNANATLQRTILHVLCIMCVQLMCDALDFTSVGHLFNTAAACATVNCMAMKKWTVESMMMKDTFEMIWHALQPVAVILVCCFVDFAELNPDMIWQSLVIFLVSYVMRVSLVLLSTHFSGKPIKQRVFMSLCWTARGLTQGLMSGTLMEVVRKTSTPKQTRDVLTVFTVDLIAGNVIGALQIWFLGPKLLPQNEPASKV